MSKKKERIQESSRSPASLTEVDPLDLLRAMLAISPEDAAAVREDAAEAMRPAESEQGVPQD